jgi:hypothetical protein
MGISKTLEHVPVRNSLAPAAGFYEVQAKFTDAVKRGNEQLSKDK